MSISNNSPQYTNQQKISSIKNEPTTPKRKVREKLSPTTRKQMEKRIKEYGAPPSSTPNVHKR